MQPRLETCSKWCLVSITLAYHNQKKGQVLSMVFCLGACHNTCSVLLGGQMLLSLSSWIPAGAIAASSFCELLEACIFFSTQETHTSKGNAQTASIMHACHVLIKAKTGYSKASSPKESLLLACLTTKMQRRPVQEDMEYGFVLDSNNSWRCVITLHCLGGLQLSNPKPQTRRQGAKASAIRHACAVLRRTDPGSPVITMTTGLACGSASNKQESCLVATLSKHMQRPPVEGDVEFRYTKFANNAWQCVVTLRALGGLEYSTPRLHTTKSNAKVAAITCACNALEQNCTA
ncbi:unnamed protein product [Polarella glacialis]|uniref:Uncharacterized protein n=1 Tax=Polarella glacialis TaxID=89957 RepID=A0A813LRA8_POLGL|nr:unnamed protein product [Polarella glacialis]